MSVPRSRSDFDAIKQHDYVVIMIPAGYHPRTGQEWKEATGRVVMRSAAGGWVLNMGGHHGKPGLCGRDNFVRIERISR